MINNQVIALLNISLQGRETMKEPRGGRGKLFPKTNFPHGGPSSGRAISEFTGMIDQTRKGIDDCCCNSLEGHDCPAIVRKRLKNNALHDCPEELKQKCFEQFMSLPNSMTVS